MRESTIRKLIWLYRTVGPGAAVWETIKAAIAHFTAKRAPLRSLKTSIDPVQDLHGQDSPYPAGGGKNKFDNSIAPTSLTAYSMSGNAGTYYGRTIALSAGTYTLSFTGTTTAYIYGNIINSDDSWDSTFILTNPSGQTPTVTLASGQYMILYVASGSQTELQGKIQIEAGNQATTYAPYSNICPITGHTGVNVWRTGANVWDEEWEQGTISSATGADETSPSGIRSKNYIELIPNAVYYFCTPTSVSIKTRWYDSNKNYIGYTPQIVSKNTFTVPSGAKYLRFATQDTYGSTYLNDISINYPSTDTTYHAYSGQDYAVQFPTMGKNIIDVTSWLNSLGISYTVDNDGWYVCVSLSGTSGNLYANPYSFADTQNRSLLLLLDTSRTTATNVRARMLNNGTAVAETSTGNPSSATIENRSINQVGFNFGSNGAVCFKLMVVDEATAPTAYEPYTNTVYSGTLDVVSGELVVDSAEYVLKGDETWTAWQVGNSYFSNVLSSSNYAKAEFNTVNCICEAINSVTTNSIYNGANIYGLAVRERYLYITQPVYDMIADLTGTKIVYELLTPITYQLTPTEVDSLLGVNNIWTDCGETEVTYKKA